MIGQGTLNSLKKWAKKQKNNLDNIDEGELTDKLNDFASIMFRPATEKDKNQLLGYALSGKGKALLIGSTVLGAGMSASQESDSLAMGQNVGIRNATPSMKPYLQDISGGASGDLVFALHNNRNRGYL